MSDSKTKTILLVDDVKDLADVLADVLKLQDYNVTVSYSGKKAFEVLEQDSSVSLVITDIIMPDIDGIDLIDHIKANHPDLPIIAMSGGGVSLQSGEVLQIVESKVTKFFEKPVCLDTLVKTVDEIFKT